jgi:hypothetical protein
MNPELENPTEQVETAPEQSKLKKWFLRLGFWGFLFFLIKGLLWLTIPALIAILAN